MIDFSPYGDWAASFLLQESKESGSKDSSFNSLPVYGAAYRLAVEATEMAARIERNYRYSLGEDIRKGVKSVVLSISLAGKGYGREDNIHSARLKMLDIQLTLRLLNDLKVLPDKRFAYFLDITEDIVKQLSNWERSLSKQRVAAGMPSPP